MTIKKRISKHVLDYLDTHLLIITATNLVQVFSVMFMTLLGMIAQSKLLANDKTVENISFRYQKNLFVWNTHFFKKHIDEILF